MKKKAREMLEGDKTPHLEMSLVRKIGGSWRELPAKRSTSSVEFDPKVLKETTENSEYTHMHTHPRLDADTYVENPAAILVDENEKELMELYPEVYKPVLEKGISVMKNDESFYSSPDILGLLKYNKAKTEIVAQRDPVTGKVAGFFFLRKTKQTPHFPEYPLEETEENLEKFESEPKVKEFYDLVDSTGFDDLSKGYEGREKALEKIAKHYHLKLRPVPAKGYGYERGRFVKKQHSRKAESELEEKVVASFIGIISFAIVFIAIGGAGLTGYATAESFARSSGLLIMLIASFIALVTYYFWVVGRNKIKSTYKSLVFGFNR